MHFEKNFNLSTWRMHSQPKIQSHILKYNLKVMNSGCTGYKSAKITYTGNTFQLDILGANIKKNHITADQMWQFVKIVLKDDSGTWESGKNFRILHFFPSCSSIIRGVGGGGSCNSVHLHVLVFSGEYMKYPAQYLSHTITYCKQWVTVAHVWQPQKWDSSVIFI